MRILAYSLQRDVKMFETNNSGVCYDDEKIHGKYR